MEIRGNWASQITTRASDGRSAALLLVALAAGSIAQAADVFVAPTGNDAADGSGAVRHQPIARVRLGLVQPAVAGFAGQPVDEGLIEFIPVDSTPGPSFGGLVKAGRYDVPAAQGGHAGGTYRVQITASRASGKTFTVEARGLSRDGEKMEVLVPVMENLIPEKYNVASTLRVTITPEASAAGIDFALE